MGLISRVSSRTHRRSSLSEQKKMQLFIKDENQTQTLEAEPSVTIAELREAIDAAEARLLCAGQELNSEDATLEDLKIQDESTIEIVHRVLGGGRKRKKKVYTTPKKIKHKRKKVKLATLKYYKVTDTGKIERKRKESPMHPGCFMAAHKGRYYCGKTGLTIMYNEPGKK